MPKQEIINLLAINYLDFHKELLKGASVDCILHLDMAEVPFVVDTAQLVKHIPVVLRHQDFVVAVVLEVLVLRHDLVLFFLPKYKMDNSNNIQLLLR